MYNGQQPPFRPPFPPTLAPGSNGPPGFPPFPPPQGFGPPPFPPNFPPGSTPPNGFGANSPAPPGMRPPSGMYPPPRPSHPGLGLPHLPSGLPPPPHLPGSSPGGAPGFVKEVKTTSVFVGGIAPGSTDDVLKDLLNACGPLHELKRVSGASGKPQAFGFALYENPEVVMRCIRCLNGVELPDMTPEGRREGKKKALVVKVDDKTREFLEEFESTLGRTDDDEEADAICRKSIIHIIALLTDPNAAPPPGLPRPAGGRSPIEVVVPAHLQDLKEGDLPEDQRVVVLDQIAIFRENAARRERDKKKIDEEKERFKAKEAAASASRGQPSTAGYGYGNRALTKDHPHTQTPQRQWGQPQSSPQENGSGSKDRRGHDPQGYDKPVPFVKAQQAEGKGESERTDEEEEESRRQRRNRERDHALRERERRVENRERQRIDNVNREMSHRRQQEEYEEKARRRQMEIMEDWDDDEKADRGRDWFYSDRPRWRAQRQQARNREYQDDLRDRHQEEEERKVIELESEEFLKKQMAEMQELENKQRQAGLLTEDAAPIKLALNAPVIPEVKEDKPTSETAPARPRMAFGDDDEDDENDPKKKKRALVKLEYEGDEDGLSEAERIAKRNAKLLEVKARVPRDRRRLWATPIEWAAVGELLIREKIRPFVHGKMRDLLGEVDEDLADFVLENLRNKKGPNRLVEDLEPVFAEEATSFVTSLWRQIAFESAAYVAGLETGTMLA